jgi:hypothetical protein
MNNKKKPTKLSREQMQERSKRAILISYENKPVPATSTAPAYVNGLALWAHQLVLKESPMVARTRHSKGTTKCGPLHLIILKAPVLLWNLDNQRGTELVPALILSWPSATNPAMLKDAIDCWWIDDVDLAERMFKSCTELGS